MKFKYAIDDENLLEKIESVLSRYQTKLRFYKTANILFGVRESISIHIEMEPISKYSRSEYLDSFENLIERLQKDLEKKLNYKIEVNASGCDLDIDISL